MKIKPAVLRERAGRDVQEAIDYYLGEGAPQAASGFVDALEQALQHIEHHAATGSPRYAHELDLPGLRCWQLKGYPYLVFYVERDDHVDVWRVLHASCDIPAWMEPSE
ncbi:MAG: type II toxin-antitoxin system RelE/ParE family toxin [Burkholderiales bacterium]|nr:type II toxin-antitoxin system RelE/ParE family toxin [Burkholderiales bacterium]